MATVEQLLRAVKDPAPLLTAIGRVSVGWMRENFRRQSFGDSLPWPARYPSQTGAKLNVAGAVSDLAAGGDVKGRRFDDRPAGIDTGALRDSIAFDVEEDRVVIGVAPSLRDRAIRFQFGGTSVQALDSSLKEKLSRFARSTKGKPVADKIEPLMGKSELTTNLVPRKFLGFDTALVGILQEVVQDEVDRL